MATAVLPQWMTAVQLTGSISAYGTELTGRDVRCLVGTGGYVREKLAALQVATSGKGLGCAKTKSDVIVMPSGRLGQNENWRFSGLCRLPPATDIPLHWLWSESCQERL